MCHPDLKAGDDPCGKTQFWRCPNISHGEFGSKARDAAVNKLVFADMHTAQFQENRRAFAAQRLWEGIEDYTRPSNNWAVSASLGCGVRIMEVATDPE